MRGNKKIESVVNTVAGEVPWWQTLRTRMVAAGVGVVFFIGFIFWFFFIHPYVSTDDARVDADIIRVANLGASQQIEKLYVEEGSRVTSGMLLVELDRRTALAQLNRARARAHLTAADLNRGEVLAAQSGLSRQQLDRLRAEAEAAAADMRLAEIALENTYIRSPLNGIVVQKVAREGNVLETNQTAVAVVDIEHAWVSANIEETDVGPVRPGQKVKITVDEGFTLSGKVIEVRKAAAAQFALIPSDNAAGNFIKLVQRIPIKIRLDPHPGRILRVGQSVEIRIQVR